MKFHKTKLRALEEKVATYIGEGFKGIDLKNELKDFKKFKLTCLKAESNNVERLRFLWAFKQLFSIPWLLAYEHLLSPDLE